MALAIYKKDKIEIKADEASAKSITQQDDRDALLGGMAVFDIDYPKSQRSDVNDMQDEINKLCKSLNLKLISIPRNTRYVMMVWQEAWTADEVHGYLVAFDGEKDHLINFSNF